jgi:hypothetical protein
MSTVDIDMACYECNAPCKQMAHPRYPSIMVMTCTRRKCAIIWLDHADIQVVTEAYKTEKKR